MRACLDTNLLISYLLARGRAGVPVRIVRAALQNEFEAVIGTTTIGELLRSIERKPWLRRNVVPDQATAIVDALWALGVVVEEPDQPIPEVSRDFDDDYLLALSEMHQVDYLVTGDKDLLVLGEHAGVKIVSPAEFVAMLDGNRPTMETR